MKTKFYFVAALAATMLASCADDKFVGDNSPNELQENAGVGIQFGFDMKNVTRGNIYGVDAATKLGNNFYVMGTKGTGEGSATEPATSPTTTLVFDNYLVHYEENSAGTQEDNTANWEYVGVQPGATGYTNYVFLTSSSRTTAPQTIKYWDYSTDQYDFFAFSTGPNAAVSGTSSTANQIGVTNMAYGSALAGGSTAYTLSIPTLPDLKETYITDIIDVQKTNYGKEVQLQFKNIGAKVRVALYETVPGYAVKDVQFYQIDGTDNFTDANKGTNAKLISTDEKSFPTKGDIEVSFPNVGANSVGNPNKNKAAANVKNVSGGEKYKAFGTLHNFAESKEGTEADGSYLGRTLPDATFAGTLAEDYYAIVFPVSTSYPLTLRVDYTLVSTDGSGETIKIYGAKAVVPANYTRWLPNFAYTYIFKISDNTNGWTDEAHTTQGLFPITFDAVVTEATDVTGEQTTITTVAYPTITTYQQDHLYKPADEYDNDDDYLLYAQVMNNASTPAKPVGSEGCGLPDLTDANSLLFRVSKPTATEAEVIDALQNNIDGFGTSPIKGRNTITLTKDETHITNGVTTIVKGVNNNSITLTKANDGHVASINTHALSAGTYAYVYNYVTKTIDKNVYQQIVKASGAIGETGETRYSYITADDLAAWDDIDTQPSHTDHYSTAGPPVANYLYFSITKDGTTNKTYSFVSVEGKKTIPEGLLKVPATASPMTVNVDGSTTVAANTFYFEKYINNNGEYAVKVIKVIE